MVDGRWCSRNAHRAGSSCTSMYLLPWGVPELGLRARAGECFPVSCGAFRQLQLIVRKAKRDRTFMQGANKFLSVLAVGFVVLAFVLRAAVPQTLFRIG